MPSEMETATEMTNGMPSEILSFIKSAEGSAALKAPQDSEAGHKAVAMMSSGNMQSSVDLVGLVEEKITRVPVKTKPNMNFNVRTKTTDTPLGRSSGWEPPPNKTAMLVIGNFEYFTDKRVYYMKTVPTAQAGSTSSGSQIAEFMLSFVDLFKGIFFPVEGS